MTDETKNTVGDMDEQVSASDMQDLLDAVPSRVKDVVTAPVTNADILKAAENPGEPVSIPKPEIAKSEEIPAPAPQVEEKPKSANIGASAPNDADIELPEPANGKEKIEKMKKAAAQAKKPAEDENAVRKSVLAYIDPLIGSRDPVTGKFTSGIAQHTNKNGTAGQPTVMTDEVFERLKAAFLMGCTDVEACLFADISSATLYNYQKAHPEYIEQKEDWKQNPTLKARSTVYMSLGFNAELSMKYLERKKKDEFAPRTEHTGEPGENGETQPIKIEYVIPTNTSKADPDSVRADAQAASSVDAPAGSDDK